MVDVKELEVDVIDGTSIDVVSDGISVDVAKKEYVVTGDNVYIASNYDTAPAWLQNYISSTISNATANTLASVNTTGQNLLDAIGLAEDAQNTYQQSIISTSDIQGQINASLTTLNTTVNGHSATIANLDTTYVRDDEVGAIVATGIDASINGGSIGAQIGTLQTALANETSARASDVSTLSASLDGKGDASATQALEAFVGVTEADINYTQDKSTVTGQSIGDICKDLDGRLYEWTGSEWILAMDSAVAGAQAITELDAYLRDDNGIVGGATSAVEQSIETKVSDLQTTVETKWQYSDTMTLNGVTYNSGFGIQATGASGTGTVGDPYTSKFWVNAENFEFTNNAQSGSTAPFTIDASGATPQITFNGVVSFTNTDMTSYTNSGISISADGTLNGAGGGQVTTSGIGAETPEGAQTKADGAETNAKTYTDNEIGNISIPDVPSTTTSTSLPSGTAVDGSIWRQGPGDGSIQDDSGTVIPTGQYMHYQYNGTSWLKIGGTYVNGSEIVTGTIDAQRISTVDLSVQSVKPLTGGGFEVSADKTAGPVGDKNYHIYGGSIYGGSIEGALISAEGLVNKYDNIEAYRSFIDKPTMIKSVGNNIFNITFQYSVVPYTSTLGSYKKVFDSTLMENYSIDEYPALEYGGVTYTKILEYGAALIGYMHNIKFSFGTVDTITKTYAELSTHNIINLNGINFYVYKYTTETAGITSYYVSVGIAPINFFDSANMSGDYALKVSLAVDAGPYGDTDTSVTEGRFNYIRYPKTFSRFTNN